MRGIAILPILVIGLLIGSGGVAVHRYYFSDPKTVLTTAVKNLLAESVVGSLIELKFNASDMQGTVTVDGVSDVSRLTDIRSRNDVSITFTPPETSAAFTLDLEARVIGTTTYLKADTLPRLGGFLDLSAYEGKWFSIENDPATVASHFDLSADLLPETNLTDEEIAHIKQLYGRYPFVVVTEDMSVAGESTFHYRLGFDREVLVEFLRAAALIAQEREGTPTPTEEELHAAADSFLEAYQDSSFETWINRISRTFHKIVVTIEPSTASSADSVTVSVVFSYPSRISVEKPEKAQSLNEVFGELFGGFAGASLPKPNPSPVVPRGYYYSPPSSPLPSTPPSPSYQYKPSSPPSYSY